jgi:outer membrane lipoprotein carrier protein
MKISARFLVRFFVFYAGYWLLATAYPIYPTGYCLLATAYSAQAASIADIVKKLQSRYESTAGFRANFTQQVESATLGQTIESRGTVVFKKPGRMRWEFTEPKQTLVSDGKSFWFYQPAENQVIKTPFQNAFTSSTPASFLLGVGQLEKDFTVSLTNETAKVYQLRLTPKQDPEAIGTLDLTVNTKTYDIEQAVVTDPLGNVTRLQLTNIDRAAPITDETFHFKAPAGVDVVEPIPGS